MLDKGIARFSSQVVPPLDGLLLHYTIDKKAKACLTYFNKAILIRQTINYLLIRQSSSQKIHNNNINGRTKFKWNKITSTHT